MKGVIRNWWIHLLIIIGGLGIGLALRTVVKPRQGIVTEHGSKPNRVMKTVSRRGKSVEQIFEEIIRSPKSERTDQETAKIKVAVLDLTSDELRQLALRLLASDARYDEEMMRCLFAAWGEVAPLDALAIVDQMSSRARFQAKRTILQSWVVSDADAAFDYVNAGKARDDGRFGRDSNLWFTFSLAFPELALERAAGIPNREDRLARENEILRLHDTEKALDWLAENREGEEAKKAIPEIISSWAGKEPRKALEYLVGLDEKLQSKEAYRDLGGAIMEGNELVEDLEEQIPKKYRNMFWAGHLERVAALEPSKASQLLYKMSEGKAKRGAFYNISAQWSFKDPVAVGEWITELPSSRSRDAAISAFAGEVFPNDPQAGVEWFADMSFAGENNPQLDNALVDWLRRDPDTASSWIENQSAEKLPPKLKERVLKAYQGD